MGESRSDSGSRDYYVNPAATGKREGCTEIRERMTITFLGGLNHPQKEDKI